MSKHRKKQPGKEIDSAESLGVVTQLNLLAAIIIILNLLPVLLPTSRLWGFDYWTIFPTTVSVTILILSLVVLIPQVTKSLASITASILRIPLQIMSRFNLTLIGILVSLILLFLFYEFRSKALLYGDAFIKLDVFSGDAGSELKAQLFVQPLSVYFYRTILVLLKESFGLIPEISFAFANCVGGLIGIWALYKISDRLTKHRTSRWFIFLGTILSGSTILFFGYIETYTWAISIGLWSLYFCIKYTQTGKSICLAILTGLLAAAFHMITLTFLGVVVVTALLKKHKETERSGMLSIIFLGAILASVVIATIVHFTPLPKVLVHLWPLSDNAYWFLSRSHLGDILNQLILVAPLGVVTFVYLIATKQLKQNSSHLENRILSIAALFTFLVAFWIDPEIGAPRDWDLLSIFGFPLSLWGAYRLMLLTPNRKVPASWVVTVVLLIGIHLIPNLVEKNTPDTAIDRLDKQLWEDAHYQESYHNAIRCLSWSYILQSVVDQPERCVRYWRRRTEASNRAPQAWAGLGRYYLDTEKYDSAYSCLSRSVLFDSSDADILSDLALTEFLSGKLTDALTHIEQSDKLNPNSEQTQTYYGMILYNLNKSDFALERFRKAHALAPNRFEPSMHLGLCFSYLGVSDSALYYLKHAITHCPAEPLDQMVYEAYVTSAMSLTRYAEAASGLEKLERYYPNSPQIISTRQQLLDMGIIR